MGGDINRSASATLTKVSVRNFKRLNAVEFEVGPVTVLCGPNNSGKTTALQAIALWQAGLRHWLAKRGAESGAARRPGVSINRRDLVALPVPATNLLWYRAHTRDSRKDAEGKQHTVNLRIEILVEGISKGKFWQFGLEFDYPNEESIYCRPLRIPGQSADAKAPARMSVPPEAERIKVAVLPPMSGLAAIEPKWEPGRVDVLIGEGQTAQVLRNLCHRIEQTEPLVWERLVKEMHSLFRITLDAPRHIEARGEITMTYHDENDVRLDLSSLGRGAQQTLLLLSYLHANPGTVLLLDEPDAHLEILRQRQTYNVISRIAMELHSQIIAASHSEIVLQEAAQRDVVVSFVGPPHRLDNRGAHLRKWLADYPIDHLYQAESTGWVMYLEGSTDLAALQAFAEVLKHPASDALASPFVIYVANDVQHARRHFYALREAWPRIHGVALFDRLETTPDDQPPNTLVWNKREIENYFCKRTVLLDWAAQGQSGDLFESADRDRRLAAMTAAIDAVEQAQRVLGVDVWSADVKASDDVLDRVFRLYFDAMGLPMLFRKADYHGLARLVPATDVDSDIRVKLDAIVAVARAAQPAG